MISFVNQTIIGCYTIGQCHLSFTINDHHDHIINFKRNHSSNIQLYFSSKSPLLIKYNRSNERISFSLISKNETKYLSTKDCYQEKNFVKRNIRQQRRLGRYILQDFYSKYIEQIKSLMHKKDLVNLD